LVYFIASLDKKNTTFFRLKYHLYPIIIVNGKFLAMV